MSRYVVKFYKEGVLRYISHLDLLRLFKRSFKRVDIKLQYSQGFNPHPKMSFAQPLSLGYDSKGEYLEFDTVKPYSTSEIKDKLNSIMPEGIGIISCSALPDAGKSLAALTTAADYEICVPIQENKISDLSALIKEYLSGDTILIQKHQKKSGKDIEVNIKPMIYELSGLVDNNNIVLACNLAAGSTANLSPEFVLSSFCIFAKIEYDRTEVHIERKEIYFED